MRITALPRLCFLECLRPPWGRPVLGSTFSGIFLLRSQWHQSPCWMTDLKYSYLVLNNQTYQPPSKKTKARTRGITPQQNHTCVCCIIQDVVIEVMNCAYATHLLIVVNIFKPFLQALVDSRENRAVITLTWKKRKTFPFMFTVRLRGMVPVIFGCRPSLVDPPPLAGRSEKSN